MADHLAQHLVDLGRRRLGPDRSTKLTLQHRERAFDIRPLVMVRQELLPVELEVVVHLRPDLASVVRDGSRLERDIRGGPQGINQLHVSLAQVALVGRHFGKLKPLCRAFHQSSELRKIADFGCRDFNAGNNVRSHSRHQMHFEPLMFAVRPCLKKGCCPQSRQLAQKGLWQLATFWLATPTSTRPGNGSLAAIFFLVIASDTARSPSRLQRSAISFWTSGRTAA